LGRSLTQKEVAFCLLFLKWTLNSSFRWVIKYLKAHCLEYYVRNDPCPWARKKTPVFPPSNKETLLEFSSFFCWVCIPYTCNCHKCPRYYFDAWHTDTHYHWQQLRVSFAHSLTNYVFSLIFCLPPLLVVSSVHWLDIYFWFDFHCYNFLAWFTLFFWLFDFFSTHFIYACFFLNNWVDTCTCFLSQFNIFYLHVYVLSVCIFLFFFLQVSCAHTICISKFNVLYKLCMR